MDDIILLVVDLTTETNSEKLRHNQFNRVSIGTRSHDDYGRSECNNDYNPNNNNDYSSDDNNSS